MAARLLLSALLVLCAGIAPAMFVNVSESIPVDRLFTNIGEYLAKYPNDGHAHYVAGRVHAMLFAKEVDSLKLIAHKPLATEDARRLPDFPPWESVLVQRAKGPLSDAAAGHLEKSILHYARATALRKRDAKSLLALGWMLENGAAHVAKLGAPPDEPERKLAAGVRERWNALLVQLGAEDPKVREAAHAALLADLEQAIRFLAEAVDHEDAEIRQRVRMLVARRWRDRALGAYRKAFALALPGDRKKKYLGPEADHSIAGEAGEGILRLLGQHEMTEAERTEAERVRSAVKGLAAKGRAITPVVFPLRGPARLADCVDASRTVVFDLDGDDVPERRPWVRPDTAILVWDPQRTGRITSGRQLFGSVTWWIAWRDGYEPLAALDDDADGRLTGGELAGIAVWVDRNGNAVSDPGEVTPAREFGIVTIAVRGTTRLDGVPAHAMGVRFHDGSTRPTYDWIAEPR